MFILFMIDGELSIGVGDSELRAVVVVLEVGLGGVGGTMGAEESRCTLRVGLGFDYDLPRIFNFFTCGKRIQKK